MAALLASGAPLRMVARNVVGGRIRWKQDARSPQPIAVRCECGSTSEVWEQKENKCPACARPLLPYQPRVVGELLRLGPAGLVERLIG